MADNRKPSARERLVLRFVTVLDELHALQSELTQHEKAGDVEPAEANEARTACASAWHELSNSRIRLRREPQS